MTSWALILILQIPEVLLTANILGGEWDIDTCSSDVDCVSSGREFVLIVSVFSRHIRNGLTLVFL